LSSTTPLRSRPFLEKWGAPLIAEAIGTFGLVFFGVGSIIMTANGDLVAIALANGLAIAVLVLATGHISGGLFNPALTIGLWVTKRMQRDVMLAYIGVQIAGAVIAALALKAIFPSAANDAVSLGVPAVGDGYTVGAALLAEIITTFFLMYAVMGNAVDPRGKGPVYGLGIGLVVTASIFATGAVSGAAMNPARWFGPALIQNVYGDWWIWIVGPIIGAVVAALLYEYIYLAAVPPLDPNEPPRSEGPETTA
jgi:aquaporin TIP